MVAFACTAIATFFISGCFDFVFVCIVRGTPVYTLFPYTALFRSLASGATVNFGGEQEVNSGGTARGTILNNGAVEFVASAGVASGFTIKTAAVELILSGGTDLGTQISGGKQDVFGSASGAAVFAG